MYFFDEKAKSHHNDRTPSQSVGTRSVSAMTNNLRGRSNEKIMKGEDYDLSNLDDPEFHKETFLKYYSKKPQPPKFGSFLRSALFEDHFGFQNFGQVLVYLCKIFGYFREEFFDEDFLLAVEPKLESLIEDGKFVRKKSERKNSRSRMPSRMRK